MANMGNTPISNNTNLDSNESSDVPFQFVINPGTNDVNQNLLDQQIDPLVNDGYQHDVELRHEITPTQDYDIDVVQTSTLSIDNSNGINLGASEPMSIIHTIALNQPGQIPNRIDAPSDQWANLVITYRFSNSVGIHRRRPREVICVQDTQPHSMPILPVLNNIGTGGPVNIENSHLNSIIRERNNLDNLIAPLARMESIVEATVAGDDVSRTPSELPRDIDLSMITSDPQNGNELGTNSDNDDDEQRLLPDSFQYTDSNENLTSRSHHEQGEAMPNTETVVDVTQNSTSSNQTNLIGEQSLTTTLTIESERYIDAPTEGDLRNVLSETYVPAVSDPKFRNTTNSSDESGEETGE